MKKQILWVALGVVLGAGGLALAQHAVKAGHGEGTKLRVLLEQVLREKLDGKEAQVILLEVEKDPGTGSPPHRPPEPVFGYVLEGEFESQLKGEKVKTYKKGDVFYEPTGAVHQVSRNPSKTTKTRLLAVILSPKDAKELVIPEKP